MGDEKGMPSKGAKSSHSEPHRASRCCADCGAEAIYDGRDEYTLCNCYSRSEWVNDGRGGYHTGGQIVDYDREASYSRSPYGQDDHR